MKTFIASCLLLTFGGFAAPAQSPAPAPTPYGNVVQNYTLAFSDEFDGSQLDQTKWIYRTDSKMWSTQEPANVTVSNGTLKIALKSEDAGGKHYTGGGVISKEAFEYGYYEARFKVPPGSGWHTSFWAMLFKPGKGTKPNGTQEIDFCEQDSVKTTDYSAGVLAWDQHGKGYGRKYVKTPNLADDFHVWGCEFTPATVKFYFDGNLTHQTASTQFRNGQQNIWLTCIASQLGGTWGVDKGKLPAVAEFDYVRYYKPAGN